MKDRERILDIAEARNVFIKRLVIGVVIANLFFISLAGFSLQQARLQYEERAEIATQNLANMLAESISESINKIDLTLLMVSDEVEKQFASGGINSQSLNALIHRQHARLPFMDGLRMVNAQGENAYGIDIVAGMRSRVDDRPFFIRLRSDPNAGLFISAPVVGRVSKKWQIVLARRVNKPDGSFGGVIYGTITLEYFRKIFSSIDIGKRGIIVLRDEDLTLIARYPELEDFGASVGKKDAPPELQKALKLARESGSYQVVQSFDKIKRTSSYRKVSNPPLYIIVGLAYEDYLGAWWHELIWVSALSALFILGTLVSAVMLYRGWLRRTSAVQALALQEDALKETNSRLAEIIDFLPDATFVIDNDKKVIAWNKAMEEMSGVSKEEMLGRGDYAYTIPFYGYRRPQLLDLLYVSDHEIKAKYQNVHKQGERLFAEAFAPALYGAKGAHIWMTVAPLYDSRGNRVGAVEAIRDITDRINAETVNAKLLLRQRAILDNLPMMAWLKNTESRLEMINEPYAKACGLTVDECIGKTDLDLFPEEMAKGYMADDHAVCVSGLKKRVEEAISTPDGIKWHVTYKTPLFDENGLIVGTTGIAMDVTELKRAEVEREKLEAQLLQAQKMEAVGQLAGGVAHDFNNILATMMSTGYLLEQQLKGIGYETHYVSEMMHAVDRAAALTKSLLAFSRRQHMNPQPIDLNTTIHQAEKILSRTIGEDIHLSLQLTEQNSSVNADSNQIVQILINLAANARDAMPKGGNLTIGTSRTIIDESFILNNGYGIMGDYILLAVADNGIGLEKGAEEKIFEPFYTTKDVGKGTGLGLSMVYGIVKQHNGFINVDSLQEKGTKFNIYLPALEAQAIHPETDQGFTPIRATETILVVEDDISLRNALKEMLQSFGHAIIEAQDGDEAVRKFGENKDKIQLVLMDVIMPHKSGADTYLELKAISPDLKIILMSGYAANYLSGKVDIKDDVSFIEKPVTTKKLFETIRGVLNG